ncbi:uncharacterized protein TRIADDRAFT_28394 [Trichoplax adhaerens]|uniref:Protein-lysine N-trimethyltransferase SMYD5 n=1 Tax=Trichoplax adhaerens TaxID=10228 RepID=B3S3A5_TRIAD|nr:hypothetical protein TRIADDRAFT_28394 [Trichoplax adhaerens]EDV22754.1 hypothetical protein TRIADDRAFT_28394 [Trichoplax adhaerens]|eukprot:XP_002114620.1 hypothetical protein TRIADDRAFT_28394 [Trichoplax adhaerens]
MDLNLFQFFTKDLPVEVKYINNARGKGLFATNCFNEGDEIFKENPLVCAQFLWNEFYKYEACEYCLRSLEDAETMARRLSGNPNVVLPHKEYCSTYAMENYVKCPRCQVTMYCSSTCLEKAVKEYHRSLCCGSNNCRPDHSLNRLRETWRNIHYPPETSSIMLIAKMIAMIEQADDPMDVLKLFSQFSRVTANNEAHVAHKLFGKQFVEQIEILRLELINTLPSSKITEWYTPGGFRSLLAMIGTNGQGIASSSFSQYARNVDAAKFEKQEEDYINSFLDQLYADMNEESGDFLDCEGSGLYLLQSCCNHDCSPNVEINFLDNNATLTVKAIRNISEGQELCISYIDSDIKNWKKRQAILMENYLFECTCNRCMVESQQPEPLSSSESEDSDDMDVGD